MRKNRDKNARPRKGNYLCHTKIQNVNVSGNVSIARNETLSGECSASKPGRDTTVFQSQRPTLFQIKNRETNGKQLGSCCLQSEGLTRLCRLRVRARVLSCRRRNIASLCKRLWVLKNSVVEVTSHTMSLLTASSLVYVSWVVAARAGIVV